MRAGTKPIPFVLIINRTTFHLQLQSKPLITKGLPRYVHWAPCSLTRVESFSVLSLLCSWSLASTAIIPTRISVRSHTAKSGLSVKRWGRQQPYISTTIPVLHPTVLYCIRHWHSLQLSCFQSAMLPGVVIKGDHWMKPFQWHLMVSIFPLIYKRHIFNVCTPQSSLDTVTFLTAFFTAFCKPMGSTL